MSGAEVTDVDLVARSVAGDREAFGQIVERYQSLVCSLAYNATGSVSQSEDLAQETFLAAWRTLRDLREPAKLRAWLCSIARHRIQDVFRRQVREPSHAAEPLENAHDKPGPEPLPSEGAIRREEEAILWRSIEQIPEIYREPLVLFYRRQKSVECVARDLDLGEDLVRQRLSRGRKLLQEQVMAFVEVTLERTTPGKAFTLAVMAALPAVAVSSAKAASLGVAGGKIAVPVAKTLLGVGAWGGLLGGLGGILGGAVGGWASWQTSRYQRQRDMLLKRFIFLGLTTLVFLGGLAALGASRFHLAARHPAAYGISLAVWIFSYVGLTLAWSLRVAHTLQRIQIEELAAGTAQLPEPPAMRRLSGWAAQWEGRQWRSRLSLFGLPLIDIAFSSRHGSLVKSATMSGCSVSAGPVAKGWFAFGDRAYGILFACGNVAVGGVALGGVSLGIMALGGASAGVVSVGGAAIGVASLGGLAIGPIAWGGAALGVWAMGGLAVGWLAFGGAALGWQAAKGGLACAHHFAVGGQAIARNANNPASVEFITATWFFRAAEWLESHVIPLMRGPWFFSAVLGISFLAPLLILAIGYRRRAISG